MLSKPAQSSFAIQYDIEFECLLFLAEAHQARLEEIAKSDPQAKQQPRPTTPDKFHMLLRGLRKSERVRVA